MSIHMHFALSVLNTLFHNIFDVVRSAVRVMSSPGYDRSISPCRHADSIWFDPLGAIVYHHARVSDGLVLGGVFYLFVFEHKY